MNRFQWVLRSDVKKCYNMKDDLYLYLSFLYFNIKFLICRCMSEYKSSALYSKVKKLDSVCYTTFATGLTMPQGRSEPLFHCVYKLPSVWTQSGHCYILNTATLPDTCTTNITAKLGFFLDLITSCTCIREVYAPLPEVPALLQERNQHLYQHAKMHVKSSICVCVDHYKPVKNMSGN